MNLYDYFSRIIRQELNFNVSPSLYCYKDELFDPMYYESVARRILEVAKSSTVLRCCATNGRLTEDQFAAESVAAHTNLALALADYAIDSPSYSKESHSRYSHREITEAIRLHDLPENEVGDIPDNENLDLTKKSLQESEYYTKFFSYYPEHHQSFTQNVKAILNEMEKKSTNLGCTIYLADKLSAVIMALYYDSIYLYPYAKAQDESLSQRGRDAIELCDHIMFHGKTTPDGEITYEKRYLLSELWTIDFLKGRQLYQYDFNGFFTATLVMTTLIAKGCWYLWREIDYNNYHYEHN